MTQSYTQLMASFSTQTSPRRYLSSCGPPSKKRLNTAMHIKTPSPLIEVSWTFSERSLKRQTSLPRRNICALKHAGYGVLTLGTPSKDKA